MKKIVFLSGNRADYGKLKSLIKIVEESDNFESHIFITGMHLLSRYGLTCHEIEKEKFSNVYKYINQSIGTKMDLILSNTILGFSNYVNEIKPDMIVVHGDRLEALAAAIVGAFNNILVAHIEGGEISGTIDESIRHSITKLAHLHFVANEEAKKRILQLGEDERSVFVIGSPDIDIMLSDQLPDVEYVKKWYEIPFAKYSILIFHPVTTEVDGLEAQVKNVVSAIINSNKKYIVIYPNNDEGTEFIFKEYEMFENNPDVKLFPSLRFEYFLTLLKNADFIIGNSSSGIREAIVYGVPCINIGSRQNNRVKEESFKGKIINTPAEENQILDAINSIEKHSYEPMLHFGEGNSASNFFKIISGKDIWGISFQKSFVDLADL